MKIGISTSVIQRGKTGIAQYLFALLRAFDTICRNERFVLFALEQDRSFFSNLSDRFEIVSVPERFRPPIQNILWHQTVLPRLIQDLSVDVMHIPSYRRLLGRKPCPLVATIHDLAPFRVSKKYDPVRMLYGKVVVKHLARRQDQIIAVSANTADDIETFFGIPRSSVNIVHNGLDHARFRPRTQSEQETVRTKFSLDQPYLLYVARLEHPGKNHVRLIEAFEQFKKDTRCNWLLALGGSDWHGAEIIHERIRVSPYHSDIRALGFVSDAELPALYSAAEIFTYPSLYEGFGLPPLEAMACRVPVICSDRGSLGEVVGDAATIIIPEDPGSIAAALSVAFRNPQSREQFCEKGIARAREFTWERCARETLSVYQEAFCGQPARPAATAISSSAATVR